MKYQPRNKMIDLIVRAVRSCVPARIDQYLYEMDCPASSQMAADRIPGEAIRHYSLGKPSGDIRVDRRLTAWRECYQLLIDDSVVHESWLRRDVYLPRRFGFSAKTPVIGDSATPPPFRGRGYFPRTLGYIVDACEEEKVYVLVGVRNQASIRGIERAGFQRVARLTAFRLCGLLLFKQIERRG